MPHIHLETTADLCENVDIPEVLEALVTELALIETFEKSSAEAHHSLRSVWAVSKGAREGFAHCSVAVLAGRSPELLNQVGERLHAVLKRHFVASIAASEASVTLEIREMNPALYRK